MSKFTRKQLLALGAPLAVVPVAGKVVLALDDEAADRTTHRHAMSSSPAEEEEEEEERGRRPVTRR